MRVPISLVTSFFFVSRVGLKLVMRGPGDDLVSEVGAQTAHYTLFLPRDAFGGKSIPLLKGSH